MSIAERVAWERGEVLGKSVGYQVSADTPIWSQHQNNDYRHFSFDLRMTIIVILRHRQMTRVKSPLKVNQKGQGKYMLIWSIFSQSKIR